MSDIDRIMVMAAITSLQQGMVILLLYYPQEALGIIIAWSILACIFWWQFIEAMKS